MADQIAFEADPANAIVVREDLRSPHPLVKATRDVLEGEGHVESWHRHHKPVVAYRFSLGAEPTKALDRRRSHR